MSLSSIPAFELSVPRTAALPGSMSGPQGSVPAATCCPLPVAPPGSAPDLAVQSRSILTPKPECHWRSSFASLYQQLLVL
ncbi:hypothetical protein MHYP_G00233580 [Metynnis hypsauchen]